MKKITVQTNVNADILKVWDCYTAPEHIMQWNYARVDWHCPKVQNDLKIGGRFIARMEAKDASEGFFFAGVYTTILFGKRMVYVMDNERTVSVDFQNNENNNVDVILTFDVNSENRAEKQREDWLIILDNFKKYVESN